MGMEGQEIGDLWQCAVLYCVSPERPLSRLLVGDAGSLEGEIEDECVLGSTVSLGMVTF